VGSGSPGTGSRFSGSGFEVFGQLSGGFGSHLEDSASLWCWSCGIALSFQIENPRTCCFWCWRRRLLLDFLYVFCDLATQGVEFLNDQVYDEVLHGCLRTLEKSPPFADLFALGLYHFGAGEIIHHCARVLLHLNLWLSTLEYVEAGRCSFLFTLQRFFGQTALWEIAPALSRRVELSAPEWTYAPTRGNRDSGELVARCSSARNMCANYVRTHGSRNSYPRNPGETGMSFVISFG
jgi:hypothetical protein